MFISDYQKNNDGAFAFIKFPKKVEWLEAIQKGRLYMNNFEYFTELEKVKGYKGMGDKHEASIVMSDINLQFHDIETDNLILEAKASKVSFSQSDLLKKPVFSISCVDESVLRVVKETDEYYDTIIEFPDIHKIKEEFGEYALLISATDFLNNLKLTFDHMGERVKCGKLSYDDYRVNYEHRISRCFSNIEDTLFFKDKELEYQKEYRIVLLDKYMKEPYILDIGNVEDFSKIINVDMLIDKQLMLRVSKNYLQLDNN